MTSIKLEWCFSFWLTSLCIMNHQSRFDAGYRILGADALGLPRGMVWGGRWEAGGEGGSGWGARVHP